ncbi:MAG: FAD/NAD(P)-binding protein [Lysobacter sp.]
MRLSSSDITAPADSFDVAIIGGGAAGVLAAIHLLRASDGRVRLCVVEPRPLLGEGAAYSTHDPAHLLNVPAGGMSAFGDDPDHFVRHLQASGATPASDGDDAARRYVPRLEYGNYLRATLGRQVAIGSVHVRDDAVDVTGSGLYSIRLGSGRILHAGAVVMATGNLPRSLAATRSCTNAAAIISAWDYEAIATIPADADVCIIGTGLSMADAAVSLAGHRHRGRITVLSRHGLMPLAHAAGRGPVADVDGWFALGVRERMRAIRARAKSGMRGGKPWQWTMDGLRPHGQRLWRSLDDDEQRRFLRHAQRYWDIHRHRIAPEVATRIDALQQSRQLTVHAGRVASIDNGPTGFDVAWRPRGTATTKHLQVQRVIACAGIETRLQYMPSPLLAALAARGLATPDPHELGLMVDDAGALVSVDGIPQPRLLAIGSARIGHDWEATAIPELRAQAAAISERLVGTAIETGTR